MSVVLAGIGELSPVLEAAIAERLLAQGDEVRAVVPLDVNSALDPRVHVARGDLSDPDLLYRAAQGARTVVVSDRDPATALAVIEGAEEAGVSRVVVLSTGGRIALPMPAHTEWVVLVTPVTRLRGRMLLDPVALATAVDAADDLAGEVRLTLDLGESAGWEALGLEEPGTG